jgi:hypothetical protein
MGEIVVRLAISYYDGFVTVRDLEKKICIS